MKMSISSFIPTLWEARLLHHLDNVLVARHFFNQDYEGLIKDQGDTVRLTQIARPTLFDYARNQDMPMPEDLETVSQELVIGQAKGFNFQIDDIDKVQARSELLDAAMERAAYELSAEEDAYLFNLLYEAAPAENRLVRSADSPDDMYNLLIELRTIMVKNNVPAQGRAVALPPEAVGLILRDPRFIETGSDKAERRLAHGLVGRAAGFDLYEVNNTPGGNTIIAGHAMGATFASQIVQTQAYRPERRFGDAVKGLSVYGAKVTRPNTVAIVEM